MSNGDRIIPKPEEPNAFERGINLLDLAAKSAVYSAVQQPLDGVTQLFGAKAPQLFDAPKHYEFNTPEWYASTIGHGAGFMVPYLATSKATAGLGLRNGGAAKAVFDGGLSGFAFTPTAEGESMLAGRSLAAFNSSIMFGTQHFIATKMHGSLMAKAAEQPMLARSLAIHGMPISTRLAISTGSIGSHLVGIRQRPRDRQESAHRECCSVGGNRICAGRSPSSNGALPAECTTRTTPSRSHTTENPADNGSGNANDW
jgi:hypothetical protein